MWISYKTYNYIDTYQYSTFNLPKKLMITKPVWMLQYQERCMYNDQSIHNCTIPTGSLLIKLQGLSRARDEKARRVTHENTSLPVSNFSAHTVSWSLSQLCYSRKVMYMELRLVPSAIETSIEVWLPCSLRALAIYGKKALLWITEDKQRKRYDHQITARKHAGPSHNPTRSALAFSHTNFC